MRCVTVDHPGARACSARALSSLCADTDGRTLADTALRPRSCDHPLPGHPCRTGTNARRCHFGGRPPRAGDQFASGDVVASRPVLARRRADQGDDRALRAAWLSRRTAKHARQFRLRRRLRTGPRRGGGRRRHRQLAASATLVHRQLRDGGRLLPRVHAVGVAGRPGTGAHHSGGDDGPPCHRTCGVGHGCVCTPVSTGPSDSADYRGRFFPRFARNLGTGEPLVSGTEFVRSTHGLDCSGSRLVLLRPT